MSQPIIFLDRDGTLSPEYPAVRLMMQFSEMAIGRRGQTANPFLRSLVRRGARLVWNSRNPDPLPRSRGRAHPMNKRKYADPAAEHVSLLKNAGLPDSWFLPEFPEVIHCRERSKGQAMMAFCAARKIPVEMTIAFDNEVAQMIGYPADRVIAVDSNTGINKENFAQALQLLNGYLLDPTADGSQTPPQTPRQP